jgi:hypothetical protein
MRDLRQVGRAESDSMRDLRGEESGISKAIQSKVKQKRDEEFRGI